MGFLQDFMGTSQRKDIQRGRDTALGDINSGTTAAMGQFDQGISRLDPYASGGSQGFQAYLDSLGLNGRDAQSAIQSTYFNDPVQNQLMDRVTRANTRAFTGRGMNNSGAATQSLTNRLLEQWGQYQQQLSGLGQQGAQAAGAQSAINTQAGNTEFAAGQQRAGVNTSAANAIAASRGTLTNNLIGIGSVIASGFGAGRGVPSRPGTGGANALLPGGVGASPY